MKAENPYSAVRAAALADYQILDTPLEPSYDDITRIASAALRIPMALVSLVEDERQWFKSEVGVGCRETPFGSSVCAHAIVQGSDFFEIEDLRLDPRTVDNPLVTGAPHARYYAGAILRTSTGIALGTVCVLDTEPRRASLDQKNVLLGLARQTMALLELRRALLRAQSYELGQAHLMATAGHDLRQPLQVIAASMEMALRKAESPADVRRHLGNAAHAIQRLGTDLDKLAQAGAHDLDRESGAQLIAFDFDGFVDTLSPTWRSNAAQKGLAITIGRAGTRVLSDRRLLSSILGNLVGNAIKYTHRGGSLSVEMRLHQGAYLEVAVCDTGIGMTTSELGAIFAPFSQVNATSEGLGLGLSLVKRAADYLGYKIEVVSTPRVGSRFSFLIPVAQA